MFAYNIHFLREIYNEGCDCDIEFVIADLMFQNIQPEKLFGVLRIMEDEEVGEV